jgi:hypothetical protein
MNVPRQANAFDASINNRAPPQVSLTNVVRRMIRENNRSLRVCLPGKIVHVTNSYSVDIQPLLQSQYNSSQSPVTLPVLPGVPVSMPCGADFAVQFPLAVGDCGLLVFADRSIDTWLAGSGDLADPKDARLHDITDAIFIPGLLTDTQGAARANDTTDMVLQNGAGHVRVKKTGQVAIGNAQADLAAQVRDLAQQVQILAQSVATSPCAPGKPVDPSMETVVGNASKIASSSGTIAS